MNSGNNNDEFYRRVEKNQIEITQFNPMAEDYTLFKVKENRSNQGQMVRLNLHNAYLPCAVFVPMYGQLMYARFANSRMWNVLQQLGESVLMCDTDSVKYVTFQLEIQLNSKSLLVLH